MAAFVKPISNVPARIDSLYNRGLRILSREMQHLDDLSVREKLTGSNAKDLRDYIKLLGELKEAHAQREVERAAKAKAEEEAKAKAALDAASQGEM